MSDTLGVASILHYTHCEYFKSTSPVKCYTVTKKNKKKNMDGT